MGSIFIFIEILKLVPKEKRKKMFFQHIKNSTIYFENIKELELCFFNQRQDFYYYTTHLEQESFVCHVIFKQKLTTVGN